MQGKIQKWGNSHAVRIPKAALASSGLSENDSVKIVVEKNCIHIHKIVNPAHRTLRERMVGTSCDGNGEWITGKPTGEEVF